jgi:murein DD-endopeptidase MepM/ murein hydrolase activator NlpD
MAQTSHDGLGLIILRNPLFEEGAIWIISIRSFFQWSHNYYATDWNKPDGNDENALVLAIADGIVSAIDTQCTATRYGCYVQIDHASSYRTLYAHLNAIYVQSGVNVGVGQIIGRVGCTGNCADPHLHMSFWHWDLSDYPYHYEYFSQCYNGGGNCPNGEVPYYPQGYRPSPMWTTYGNAILADGIPFTSVNGHSVFLPLVIKSFP